MTSIFNPRLAGYIISAALVYDLAYFCPPFAEHFGTYWCISFWTLIAAEALLSMHREIKSGWSPVDRFIGYIVFAPFIMPARLITLLYDGLAPAKT